MCSRSVDICMKICRGGPRGRFQGGGQLRSGDKCRLYVYERSKESKDCASLAIDTPDVPTFPAVMKKDVSVGVSKPKKTPYEDLSFLEGEEEERTLTIASLNLCFQFPGSSGPLPSVLLWFASVG